MDTVLSCEADDPGSILRGEIKLLLLLLSFFLTTLMRVYSEILQAPEVKSCGVPLLSLAKSIC